MASRTTESRQLTKLIGCSRLSSTDRRQKQSAIYQYMLGNSESIGSGNFAKISGADLGTLFQVTDEQFFDGLVGKVCERVAARPLAFRLSTRMTSAGGMTTMQRPIGRRRAPREFEIAVATTPLFESFRSKTTSHVGGLKCHDRLQALQRIMEHEMVHLIEMLLSDDSNCSADPFKKIVFNFFGHTESNHRLLTPSDSARQKLGIAAGDRVAFHSDGQVRYGILQRITKRATVIVPDKSGAAYDDGRRYQKYYVPLARLRRA